MAGEVGREEVAGVSATGPATAAGHEAAPLPGSVYTSTGLPGSVDRAADYPLEAVCSCHQVIECRDIRQRGWAHTGRKAGDPR